MTLTASLRRRAPRLFAGISAGCLLAGTAAARAEPPSADALQAQLRAALAGAVAPAKDNASALTVTRQGERYSILLPITGTQPEPPDQPAGLLTVVHPIDGGRWAIDAMTLPSASTVTIQAPPGGLKDAGTATMQVHIDRQAATGVFDPSHATASTLDARASGVRTETVNAQTRQHTRYDSYHLQLGLVPHAGGTAGWAGAPGALDLDQKAELSGLHLTAEGKTTFSVDADQLHLNGTLLDLSPDRAGALYGAVFRMTAAILAGPQMAAGQPAAQAAPDVPVPMDRTTIRALLDALPGLADKLDVVESADGMKVKAADSQTYRFDHAALGFGGAASDGVMAGYLDISLDNLQAPDAPDDVRALLPRRVHLHPTLGGIGTTELLALANAASGIGQNGSDSGALIATALGLFAHGGIKLGVTDLDIEFGDCTITGTGQLNMPAPLPAVFKGEGRIVAKNFDALVARVQADPKAAQAVGMLMAAKQLAKPDGDTLVWNIAYRDGGVFVNGKPLAPPRPRPGAPGQPPGGVGGQPKDQ